MRRVAGVFVAMASVLGAAACGDDETERASAADAQTETVDAETTTGGIDDGPDAAASTTGSTTEVTIEHFSGTDTVPVMPETVVVMDTGVLLSMDALGIDADAFASLGAPVPAEHSAVVENPDLVPVGTAFEPDYEAINAIEPDLIIVASRSSAAYPELSKIAPTIDLTLSADVDYLTAFRARHEALGTIFGVEDEVARQLAELEGEIAGVRSRSAQAGRALIVMTNGNEISAYGPGSRFGFVHDVFGFAVADEHLARDATHGDVVSFEYVAEMAPDVMFVVDRTSAIGQDGEVAEQVLDNELVAETPAWQSDRVVYVDGFAWYVAGDSIPAMRSIIDDVTAGLG